jgi:iron complex transport system substrate-binding protein
LPLLEALVKVIRSLFFILSFAVVLATEYPLTVTDGLGREVTLLEEPERIVTMLPSQTETLCAVDACDKLVGTDKYSNYPEQVEVLPKLGGFRDADVEGIVALEPDFVLVAASAGELAETLEALGLTVFASGAHSGQTYESTLDEFLFLGRLVNRETQAQALVESTRAQVDAIGALTADAPRPEVFYEISDSLYTASPASFIGTLIEKAGGENVIPAELGAFPQVDPEFVIEQNPEVIILAHVSSGTSEASLQERPGWANLDAVQNGRMYELTQTQVDALSRSGPRMVEAVRLLAQLFHPELMD